MVNKKIKDSIQTDKYIQDYEFLEYSVEIYPTETFDKYKQIYLENFYKQFIDSCKNGDVLFILKSLRYGKDELFNEGMIWASCKGHLEIVEILLNTQKIWEKTVKKCARISKQYDHNDIYNLLKDTNE